MASIIPTAEEIASQIENSVSYEELINPKIFASLVAKKYAELHVTAALKACHSNNQLPEEDLEFTLDCYPLTNIQ